MRRDPSRCPGHRTLCRAATLLSLCGACACAQTVDATWLGGSGLWSDVALWDTSPFFPDNDNPPGTTYFAHFTADLLDPFTVTLDQDITIDGLEFSSAVGTLLIDHHRFEVTGDAYLNAGVVRLKGANLAGGVWHTTAGQLRIESGGSSELHGVTIDGDVTVDTTAAFAYDGFQVTGTAHVLGGGGGQRGQLRLEDGCEHLDSGTYDIDRSSLLYEGSGPQFELGPDSTVSLRRDASLSSGDAVLLNNGRIEAINGRAEIHAPTLVNEGEIDEPGVGGNIIATIGHFENNGLVRSAGASVGLEIDSGSNRGTIQADPGGLVVIDPQDFSNEGLLLAKGGIIQLGTNNSSPPSGTWHNNGLIRMAGGQVDLGDGFRLDQLGAVEFDADSRLNVVGELDLSGDVLSISESGPRWGVKGGRVIGGAIATGRGGALEITGPNGALEDVDLSGTMDLVDNGAEVTVLGDCDVHDLTVVNHGETPRLTIEDSQTFTRTTLHFTRPDGSVKPAPNIQLRAHAVLTLAADSVLEGAVRVDQRSGTSGGMLRNEGLIASNIPGETITLDPTYFENYGRVWVDEGAIMYVYGGASATNYGTFEVDGGRLHLGADQTVPWHNEGAIELTSGVLTLGGKFTSADIPGIHRLGGEVSLVGAMDLLGGVFQLDASTGSWTLGTESYHAGAVLSNGTFQFHDGAQLIPYAGSLTLKDVHLAGGIDIAGQDFDVATEGTVRVDGSIGPSRGVIQLHPDSDVQSGRYDFGAAYAGGSILFGPEADVTIRGEIVRAGPDASLENDGTLRAIVANSARRNYDFVMLDNRGLLDLTEDAYLNILGDIVSSGSIRLEAAAHLDSDTFSLSATSLLDFILGRADGTKSNGYIDTRGDVILAGDLELELHPGYSPVMGDEFDLFRFDVPGDSFANIMLPDLSGDLRWDTTDLYPSGIVRVVPSPGAGGSAMLFALMASARYRRR